MATPLAAYWPKPQVVLVADETIPLTLAYWPKVEVVLIVPVATSTRRRFAGTVI